ncbi:MAG: hypothetical protein C0437_16885 [Ralstonia sp.]|nr:hypothetical protein [Ralstonia sp.]
MGVDDPPKPMIIAVDRIDDVIKMPPVRSGSIAPHAACQKAIKPFDPEPHGLSADDKAPLCQMILDIRGAQDKPVISPDWTVDHVTRIPLALQAQKG